MKIIYLIIVILSMSITKAKCQSSHPNKFNKSLVKSKQPLHLPFIGKRSFETRFGVSGSGTPTRFIEIDKNGDVFFSFLQPIIDSDSTISESFYAGKFRPFLKCEFKKLDEIRYYKITNKMIYEVDRNKKLLKSDECCHSYNIEMGNKCPCESEYYEW